MTDGPGRHGRGRRSVATAGGGLAAATAIALLAAGLARAAADAPTPVRINVETPKSGEVVRNKVHLAPVRGNAIAEGELPADFDVIVVIDISASTKVASGLDVDGDGMVGIDPTQELLPPGAIDESVRSTDPDDSVLAAQVAAGRKLLESLDPRRVRVGLITFGGEVDPNTAERVRPDQKDAWVEVPFTNDFERVRRALVGVQARGARGATNFAAGIRLAITELAGLPGAQSTPREARKVMLFLTDGTPTLPIGKGNVQDPGDTEAAVNAARLAHKAGIVINTYALGQGALQYPVALTEMARATLGQYTPVQNPGDIVVLLQGVSFANIEDLVFTNLTTGDFSTDVELSPDGTFSGFVPVREGKNRVRVTALASDGTRASVELDLEFKMAELSDRELALELDRIRKRNKELQLLLERRRIEAFREREKQRRELELKPEGEIPVEETPAPAPAPEN
jgi:Mg-chelatase subunit ChlD